MSSREQTTAAEGQLGVWSQSPVYRRLGQSGLFWMLLCALLSLPVRGAENALSEAQRLLDQGSPREAVAVAEKALQEGVDPAATLAVLGRAQLFDQQYAAAEESLAKAVAAGNREISTLLHLSSALWENGEVVPAEEVLVELDERTSGHLLVRHRRGSLLLWQGRYREAEPFLREAVGGGPSPWLAQLELARALAGQGRFGESIEWFDRYLSRAKEDSQAVYGRAVALARTGRADEARLALSEYRELVERNREATRQAGLEESSLLSARRKFVLGEPEAALQTLKSLAASTDVLELRAQALRSLGSHAEAREALEQAIAQAPDRADLRARLAEWATAEDPS